MRCKTKLIGVILATAGLMIILAIILPTGFWWIIFGAALVALGLFVMKK